MYLLTASYLFNETAKVAENALAQSKFKKITFNSVMNSDTPNFKINFILYSKPKATFNTEDKERIPTYDQASNIPEVLESGNIKFYFHD
jgi:hypothetical protein